MVVETAGAVRAGLLKAGFLTVVVLFRAFSFVPGIGRRVRLLIWRFLGLFLTLRSAHA
jgi:hypothetical protein